MTAARLAATPAAVGSFLGSQGATQTVNHTFDMPRALCAFHVSPGMIFPQCRGVSCEQITRIGSADSFVTAIPATSALLAAAVAASAALLTAALADPAASAIAPPRRPIADDIVR